ncbi:MAG TPA: dATP pyrophosphohydrolase [Dongiaceae bacterium]|nr:dATP pyrophosphohydrolase [Dongiaceae bacterium]
MSSGEIVVEAVASAQDLTDFIGLPKRLYAGHKGYIAPLDLERSETLSKRKNPYFQHAEGELFVARRNGEPVGRISAQLCELHEKKYRDQTGHFGWLDAIDDKDVFAALTRTAERWLSARGAKRIVGPYSFSSNEESGQLIAGFDSTPMLMMPFHLAHQDRRLQGCGYVKAKDLIAYNLEGAAYHAVGSSRMLDKAGADERIKLRSLDMKNYKTDLAKLLEVFNDAWTDNWGMVPFSQTEIEMAAKSMKPLIDPDLVVIAEVDGEVAGMLVCLPNLLEAVRDLDGKLLPFGWAKLLWRLKRKTLKTARVPLMGILRKHHGTLLGATLLPLMFHRLKGPFFARGLEQVELSWILEDNMPMRRVLEGIGAKPYKTYRIYEKALT